MRQRPLVSVIIPCRNEAPYIRMCLESVARSGVPDEDIEVLVVDGESTDSTAAIAQDYAKTHPNVSLVRNPAMTTPAALNIALRSAKGRYVARLDAHSSYGDGYLLRCLRLADETGADNVGGVCRTLPRSNTTVGRAIALALSSRLGAGDSTFRTGTKTRREVDTVPFGFYRREVFHRVGTFNEHLIRGQDMEFNLRLRRAGGRIVLDPAIQSDYFARSTLLGFARHNFADGYWVTRAMKFARSPVSWRHLVPLIFVCSLVFCVAVAAAAPIVGLTLLALDLATYATAVIGESVRIAQRSSDWKLVPALAVSFAARHIPYGLGSLAGLVRNIR